ncbi:DUF3089 domain-containing protein [Vibrio sp. CB1-14]|uniref:DUF3089 domain-containing protein n=1 Tax=Vibrio chaetopteri TaxID=3016528 RepID=A0AAU8BLL7_9VIBR
MKKIILLVSVLLVSFIVFVIGPKTILLLLNYPMHDFGDKKITDAPNYALESDWELYGQEPTQDLGVDVFFIHPTGYFRSEHWNSPLLEMSAASHNRSWMMANMAVVFSDFSVYAPKYREASIYAFFDVEGQNGQSALNLAYSDVKAAFYAFLEKTNGRPFIIAGHSQGSAHGIRLLKEIEKSSYSSRLVAAYFPGGIQASMVTELITPLCSKSTETSCYVAWSTYGADYKPNDDELRDPFVCVNPISWIIDGSAEKEEHLGMVTEVGQVSFKVMGDDRVPDYTFTQLSPPISKYTDADCDQGVLRVHIPNPESYKVFSDNDYHNYDYSLFHMDVRENARLRAEQYHEDFNSKARN